MDAAKGRVESHLLVVWLSCVESAETAGRAGLGTVLCDTVAILEAL